MDDSISRQAAIDAIHNLYAIHGSEGSWIDQRDAFNAVNNLPSAQPEQKIYRSMSEEEFEAWLYNHGICHPDIHESIACDIVPSLIDDAINELPPAQPEHDGFYEFLFNVINPNDMEKYIAMYHSKGVKSNE